MSNSMKTVSYDLLQTDTQKVEHAQVRLQLGNEIVGMGRLVLEESRKNDPKGEHKLYPRPRACLEIFLGACSEKFWTTLEGVRASHKGLLQAEREVREAEAAIQAASDAEDAFLSARDPSYAGNNAELQDALKKIREINDLAKKPRGKNNRCGLFKAEQDLRTAMGKQCDRIRPLVEAVRDKATAGDDLDAEQKERYATLRAAVTASHERRSAARGRLKAKKREVNSDAFAAEVLKKYLQLRGVAATPDDLLTKILSGKTTLYELEKAPATTSTGVPIATRTVHDEHGESVQKSRCSMRKVFDWHDVLDATRAANANIIKRSKDLGFICCTQNSQKLPVSILLGEYQAEDTSIHNEDRKAFVLIVPKRVWMALVRTWDALVLREEVKKYIAPLYPAPANAHLRTEAAATPLTDNSGEDTSEGEEAPEDADDKEGEADASAAASN